jgi:fumarate reductase subunit D
MLLAFGSVVAMGLPILIALVGVGMGIGVLDAASHLLTVPTFGPELMAMIGLGVGIDYALFLVTRYRQGLAGGCDPRQATTVAYSTAGVTAAIDLYGTDTVQAARELGVPDERITTIAAQVEGITSANGADAAPGAIEEIARLVAAGQLRVPIAASFPVEQIRAAVELQAGRHVHGKVVIDL